MAPDRSRQVKATVPPGVLPGDTFLIRLALPIRKDVSFPKPVEPPTLDSQQPLFSHALENWLTPYPNAAVIRSERDEKDGEIKEMDEEMGKRVDPRKLQGAVPTPILSVAAPTGNLPKLTTAKPRSQMVSSPNDPSPKVHSRVLDSGGNTETREEVDSRSAGRNTHAQTSPSVENGASKQKLLLVHVPSGMPEGSTMQVEVPGENRTLLAQIPPGVESFHVAYTPRSQPTPSSPTPSPRSVARSPKTSSTRASSPKGQKLLLVRVPKGTPAGTTLHVSVPDEPGRILAAKVPPGNVQEFHVSYEARSPRNSSSSQRRQTASPSVQRATASTQAPVQPQQYQQPPAPAPASQQYQQQSPLAQPQYQLQSPAAQSQYQQQFSPAQQQYQQQPPSPQQQGPVGSRPFAHAINNNYSAASPVYQVPRQQQQPPNSYQDPRHSPQRQASPPPSSRRNNDGGGWGNFMLPFWGGAAPSAAGEGTNDHFYNNNGGGGGYDYAGGDYRGAVGGGFDYQ